VKSKFLSLSLSLSKLRNFSSSPKFFLILSLVLVAFRYVLGANQRYFAMPDSGFDDQLLFDYANLPGYFHGYNFLSLAKTLSFSIFLGVNKIIGLPYSFALTSIYFLAAVLIFLVVRNFIKSRVVQFILFGFVLYLPSAFDQWVGVRIYRNAIIVPFGIITLALFMLFLIAFLNDEAFKSKFLKGGILGISLSCAYFIKESGFYWLPILIFACIVVLCVSVVRVIRSRKQFSSRMRLKIIAGILVSIFPLILLFGSINVYKAVNYHFFGVYEIETRTSGEVGKFVQNIYKIKSDNRNDHIWAPFDAIEKAFETSSTLQQYPELLYDIEHNDFFEDGDPIKGDFLGWVLRVSLNKEGYWTDEMEMSNTFFKVNSEINSAFKSGALEKETRFQITSSAGGFSESEVIGLAYPILGILDDNIRFSQYDVNNSAKFQYNENDRVRYETITNMPTEAVELNSFTRIADLIMNIYKTLSMVFFIFAVVGFAGLFINLCIKRSKISNRELFSFISLIVLAGSTIVVAIGTAWFCAFLDMGTTATHFYGVDVLPFVAMFELIGFTWFCKYSETIIGRFTGMVYSKSEERTLNSGAVDTGAVDSESLNPEIL
jgi:hypothetical protein